VRRAAAAEKRIIEIFARLMKGLMKERLNYKGIRVLNEELTLGPTNSAGGKRKISHEILNMSHF